MQNTDQYTERGNDGNIIKKVKSELGDDYEIWEEKKDLRKLPKKEYEALKYHDRVRTSRKIKEKIKDATVWYGWSTTAINTLKVFI